MVGEHLAAMGHVDVGIIAGPPYPVVRERVQGCLNALENAGVQVPHHRVVQSTFDADGGRTATEKLLATGGPPTAIFAVNDSAAIGAMGCLRDHGMTAGRDVAVVGYNDIAIARDLPIALTSVHAPLRSMGETAAQLLVDLVDGVAPLSVDLVPTLEIRDSSRPPAG